MKHHVLYLTYDGLTDPLGQSQILPYLAGLSRQGFEFTILSFEKKGRLEKEGALVRTITEAANIQWIPLVFTAKPPILSKIYDRYRMWRTALTLHRKHNFQMTHCRSYVSAEVGLRLKKECGVKMLFDMRGFWADEKIDNGQWDINKPLYKKIYQHYKKKEKEFLLEADGVVSLTQAAKEYLLAKQDYKDLFIEVIPCCADLDHFDYRKITEEKKRTTRKSLKINDTAKVISYVGSFGGWYMTKEMFAFVRLLQSKHPEYILLFLTKDDPEKVKAEAEKAGIALSKLIVLYVSRPALPTYIALSNCSIFFIRNTFSKMASSPTKHAELMGMGVPVICNTIGDTGTIINTTQTGYLVNSFGEEALNKAIESLPLVEAIGKDHIRNCGAEFFDLQFGITKYLSVYKKIVSAFMCPTVAATHE
ncbi:MAG TPA: glycosyltransferase [Flavisolibacter sp.]|nr:glycosyltransferase [Flavisolibacter sp.]